MLIDDVEARFWSKVDMRGSDQCWLWKAAQDNRGYGVFSLGDEMVKAHRVAFALFYRKRLEDCVLHKCENKLCVNPHHLYEGDHSDNARDLYRENKGPKRKLSNNDVREIRDLYKTGYYSQVMLSEKFRCNQSSISRILDGQRYSYID